MSSASSELEVDVWQIVSCARETTEVGDAPTRSARACAGSALVAAPSAEGMPDAGDLTKNGYSRRPTVNARYAMAQKKTNHASQTNHSPQLLSPRKSAIPPAKPVIPSMSCSLGIGYLASQKCAQHSPSVDITMAVRFFASGASGPSGPSRLGASGASAGFEGEASGPPPGLVVPPGGRAIGGLPADARSIDELVLQLNRQSRLCYTVVQILNDNQAYVDAFLYESKYQYTQALRLNKGQKGELLSATCLSFKPELRFEQRPLAKAIGDISIALVTPELTERSLKQAEHIEPVPMEFDFALAPVRDGLRRYTPLGQLGAAVNCLKICGKINMGVVFFDENGDGIASSQSVITGAIFNGNVSRVEIDGVAVTSPEVRYTTQGFPFIVGVDTFYLLFPAFDGVIASSERMDYQFASTATNW
ncbi:hypothetical protein T492DRAFT_832442 [Pavlovales sp. CCMP2436]|nr:hypothetical protein T492DRAFT_832442 [Pavlovales sp. CCMP2436]